MIKRNSSFQRGIAILTITLLLLSSRQLTHLYWIYRSELNSEEIKDVFQNRKQDRRERYLPSANVIKPGIEHEDSHCASGGINQTFVLLL